MATDYSVACSHDAKMLRVGGDAFCSVLLAWVTNLVSTTPVFNPSRPARILAVNGASRNSTAAIWARSEIGVNIHSRMCATQILATAGVESLDLFESSTKAAKGRFADAREEFLSIATVTLENKADAFLSRLKNQAEEMKIFGRVDYTRAIQPSGQFFTRDSLAVGQGFQTPPHLAVLADISAIEDAPRKCEELGKVLRRAASHLKTRERHKEEKRTVGTNVFLGHGRSAAWKDLKDFIQDRMALPWDEFNRVPIAGTTNIARLSQMLDDAAIAFIVMTAEDEQLDGTVRARMNVIHEAGLFQGKLGFTKAILLLEEGCEEFSNIHGLGQIRFPAGNIKAAFEGVRLVLEREQLV